MNLLFRVATCYIPERLKKKELRELFQATAAAFAKAIPSTEGLIFEECLLEFARFTKSIVDQAMNKSDDLKTIQDLLYQSAYEFGAKFRKRFKVSTPGDVMAAGKLLYRILGIEFHGTEQGAVTITKCFFSQYYTPATCRVISPLDAGMLAGLSAGKGMTFSERITEGSKCCQAQVLFKGQLP